MVLTAQVVGANAALVAVYQVARGLGGNLLASAIYERTVAEARDDGQGGNGGG